MAIATGGWTVTAAHKLRLIQLRLSEFPHATSDHHYARKEIITEAVRNAKRTYGVAFRNIVYVGDGVWDYEATRELGLGFVGIDANGDNKLKNVGVSAVFSDFTNRELLLSTLLNTRGS
jgi:phosphoglycolate phosphatase-like HAD superfamily hydrolase